MNEKEIEWLERELDVLIFLIELGEKEDERVVKLFNRVEDIENSDEFHEVSTHLNSMLTLYKDIELSEEQTWILKQLNGMNEVITDRLPQSFCRGYIEANLIVLSERFRTDRTLLTTINKLLDLYNAK